MMGLTLPMMQKMWPNGNLRVPGLLEGIVSTAAMVFSKYGLTSNLLVAHFMAQVSWECGAGTEVVENLNYTAERMMQVWPSRFPNMATAAPYAHNPKALANKVYNGRMGNQVGTDDGWNFRGRGATQTTGREGYDKLGKKMGLLLTVNPDLVNDPKYFLECGAADFIICGCLEPAKNDDVRNVTLRLNGGYTDLEQREQWLVRWKHELAAVTIELPPIAQPAPEPAPAPTIIPKPPQPVQLPPAKPVPPVAKPAPVEQNILTRLFQFISSIFRR